MGGGVRQRKQKVTHTNKVVITELTLQAGSTVEAFTTSKDRVIKDRATPPAEGKAKGNQRGGAKTTAPPTGRRISQSKKGHAHSKRDKSIVYLIPPTTTGGKERHPTPAEGGVEEKATPTGRGVTGSKTRSELTQVTTPPQGVGSSEAVDSGISPGGFQLNQGEAR